VKDEFLATVSHELRTPLNAILGWATMLRDRASDPAALRGLEVIHRNAVAQARIIDDILDVSRIVTGKLLLDLKQVRLNTIAREAIDVVRPSVAAKGLSISLDADGEHDMVADATRLQQVVWNLLSNAVKFTDAGGSITVRVRREQSSLVLSVSDTGRGIEPQFLAHAFERFSQADSSTTRKVGGLGLGLSIVRHLVDLHGGTVEAFSEGLGRGATFTIKLPVRAVAPVENQARQPTQAVMPDEVRHSLSGLRVLVVDDEPDARELLEEVLQQAGCSVNTAGSADQAIELLRTFRPHVLVSDVGMPDEDGYALMQRVRALPAQAGGDVPSVALTAYTQASDRTRAIQSGFTTHMPKPVRPSDLLATIHNLALFSRH
jgi:CheY-like chemotaxis protein